MRRRAIHELGDGAGASERVIPKQLVFEVESVAGVHAALAGNFRVDFGTGILVIAGQQALH